MFNTELAQYQQDGFVIVRGLFDSGECAAFREHYMELRARGSYPGDASGTDIGGNDPMKKFPRMIHMHRWDEISLRFLLDSRLNRCMTALLGREPYAVQTMLYFKPPGARPGVASGPGLPARSAGDVCGCVAGVGRLR